MEYISSKGYCAGCKGEVIFRRKLPEMTTWYRILTILTFGFWPLYWLRVGWKCAHCGAKADMEKPHLVGRSMGGLKTFENITSAGYCKACNQEVETTRRFPPVTGVHQLLSLVTCGRWPLDWLRFGWLCSRCRDEIEIDFPPDSLPLTSHGFCQSCGIDVLIRRRVPGMPFRHRLLTLMTFGAWPKDWLFFGWQCSQCKNGPDEKTPMTPIDYIEFTGFCKKCNQPVNGRRPLPACNIISRALSLITAGGCFSYWLQKRWRCPHCNSRITVDIPLLHPSTHCFATTSMLRESPVIDSKTSESPIRQKEDATDADVHRN